jgi:hypothetical protein
LAANGCVGSGYILERPVYLAPKLGAIGDIDRDRDGDGDARHRHSGDGAHSDSKVHGAGSRNA